MPNMRQAIIWTSAGFLSIRSWQTNFSQILTKTQIFSFTKIHLKVSSAKWRPSCPGGDEFNIKVMLWAVLLSISWPHQLWIKIFRNLCSIYDDKLSKMADVVSGLFSVQIHTLIALLCLKQVYEIYQKLCEENEVKYRWQNSLYCQKKMFLYWIIQMCWYDMTHWVEFYP